MMERTLATVTLPPHQEDVIVVLTDSDGMPESPPLWASSMDDALDVIERLAKTNMLIVTPLETPGLYSVSMLLDD